MKTLVVYASAYGNTAKVATAIASAIGSDAMPIGKIDADALPEVDLLVVGSPTQGGRPTAAMSAWISSLPHSRLDDVAVAAFDTRMAAQKQGFALRLLMSVIGYAAPRILNGLQRKGGHPIAEPEGFLVEGKEGPPSSGELQRAGEWAKLIASRASERMPALQRAQSA